MNAVRGSPPAFTASCRPGGGRAERPLTPTIKGKESITAKAAYSTVRYHLGKEFSLSRTSSGRRSGQRWSEGVQVRTSHTLGVVVDYVESHSAWGSDGSLRKGKLDAVREYLERRFTVEDHPAGDGRMVVSDKLANCARNQGGTT